MADLGVTQSRTPDKPSRETAARGDGYQGPLEPVTEYCWRIPKSYKAGMRVDGLVYADSALLKLIRTDQALEQVANVAFLPGIQYASLAMPDIHWGYGFCIGGVCATDPAAGGVISPGGVGYDINCGVRLIRSNLFLAEIKPHLSALVNELFKQVPTGVGRGGKYHFNPNELRSLMTTGPQGLIKRGLAVERDIEFAEAHGRLDGAAPENVSDRALQRGYDQCGTLGAGNHFLEVQIVDRVFDERAARVMGLAKDMVCVMIHSGSRGLGYQVCDDALRQLRHVPAKYGIELPDRQLVCAPVESPEGQHYLGAMRAAANFAWCNRQLLLWQAREVFETIFGRSWQALDMQLIYDVAHNIAKLEEHEVAGERKQVWVHRKGATRAFPPGHPEVPAAYAEIGQPVIIPGDMGRASWVLAGQPGSMTQTFGSACHGAGRVLSRHAAVREARGRRIDEELEQQGIIARARSWKGLAEEQSAAYKDVDLVVEVVHKAGLASKVARLRPIGVIKG
ncbi:MAG TPA: RtcB family protein [Pirellulales bacterium]|nr:RtcB family protein [Pirellulales bacterium]